MLGRRRALLIGTGPDGGSGKRVGFGLAFSDSFPADLLSGMMHSNDRDDREVQHRCKKAAKNGTEDEAGLGFGHFGVLKWSDD